MAGHAHQLVGTVANGPADAIGIADGDVKEVLLAGSLIVSHGTFHHVSQVVEFMAQFLHLLPATAAGPVVRMLGVHGACRVEVAVRFLRPLHQQQHAVNVGFQLLVRIGLQDVAGTLYGLVNVGVVEGKATHPDGIGWMCRLDKVIIASRLLALTEGQGYGGRAAGFQPLSPKAVGYLDGSERYRADGVPVCGSLLLCLRACHANAQQGCYQVLFHRLTIFKITVFLDTKVKKSAQTTDRRIRKSWHTDSIQARFQAINPTTTSLRIWQTAPVPSPSSYT